MIGYVVDASVVLRWYLSDEENQLQALWLLDRYAAGKIALAAPTLLEYELVNALAVARRSERIDDERITAAMESFYELGIELIPAGPFYPSIFSYCREYDLSAYDAAYLAVARERRSKLVTGDQRLHRKLPGDWTWVIWISEVGRRRPG